MLFHRRLTGRYGGLAIAIVALFAVSAEGCDNQGGGTQQASAVGAGPCKYKDAVIGADPGTAAKKRLARKLIQSGCVTADTVCMPRADWLSGKLYWKAYRFIQIIARAKFKVGISCLWTGHDPDGGYHPRRQAVDLNFVNNQRANTFGREIKRLANWLKARPNGALPTEVGLPTRYMAGESRTKRSGRGPFFNEPENAPHIHFGFR